jgi:hypothetical protein
MSMSGCCYLPTPCFSLCPRTGWDDLLFYDVSCLVMLRPVEVESVEGHHRFMRVYVLYQVDGCCYWI